MYHILISESMHLIWKLCCVRIQEERPEEEWPKDLEIHNKWLATINAWLLLDISSTSRRYGKKATKQTLMLDTWDKMLKNEQYLPRNWLKSPGVLVGVDQMEHQGSILDNPDDLP